MAANFLQKLIKVDNANWAVAAASNALQYGGMAFCCLTKLWSAARSLLRKTVWSYYIDITTEVFFTHLIELGQ